MIKNLLSTVLLFTSVGVMESSAQALCTSNVSCVPADSTFGICPDSATGIPSGSLGQAYNVTMSIKFPGTTTVGGQTFTLTHLGITDVDVDTATSGAPAFVPISTVGLNYLGSGANTPSGGATGISGFTMTKFCYWDAPGNSCVILSGTPNKVGTFKVRIKSKARALVFGFGQWSDAPENTDYRLVVSSGPNGIASLEINKFEISQNIPNPFSDKTEIRFTSGNNSEVEFKVFNLLGSVVYSSNLKSVKGVNTISLEANLFNPGVYMYSIKNGANTITKRMVVSAK